MRNITKGKEPQSLEEYRCKPDAYWDGYSGKEEAFAALCREQGYLCAYCMSRIAPDKTPRKIEHWISQTPSPDSPHDQSFHKDHTLKWSNLLGVCPGVCDPKPLTSGSSLTKKTSSSKEEETQHCDTCRGNRPLAIHPASEPRLLKDLFKYSKDGRIYSDDLGAQRDIKTLNLNVWRLRTNRFGILKRLRKELENHKQWTESLLRQRIAQWEQLTVNINYKDAKGQPQTAHGYREYNQVAISFLERQLRKHAG